MTIHSKVAAALQRSDRGKNLSRIVRVALDFDGNTTGVAANAKRELDSLLEDAAKALQTESDVLARVDICSKCDGKKEANNYWAAGDDFEWGPCDACDGRGVRLKNEPIPSAATERVRERARLCDAANCRSGKAIDGEGAIYGPCPRCGCRGVTFESNTTESKEPK